METYVIEMKITSVDEERGEQRHMQRETLAEFTIAVWPEDAWGIYQEALASCATSSRSGRVVIQSGD